MGIGSPAEHAYALSRLVQASFEEQEGEEEVYLISYLEDLPVAAQDIAAATRKDPILARLYDFTLHGWPQALDDPVLQPCFSRKQELSVDRGCMGFTCGYSREVSCSSVA